MMSDISPAASRGNVSQKNPRLDAEERGGSKSPPVSDEAQTLIAVLPKNSREEVHKGVSIRLEQLPELIEALQKAEGEARRIGPLSEPARAA